MFATTDHRAVIAVGWPWTHSDILECTDSMSFPVASDLAVSGSRFQLLDDLPALSAHCSVSKYNNVEPGPRGTAHR